MYRIAQSFYAAFLMFALVSCADDRSMMFTKMASSKTGIKFKNIIKESDDFNILKYPYFYNGGGIAVGDLNNDGLEDIYFTGNLVAGRLYINKGNLEFDEITKEAGVLAAGLWNTGVLMVDVNADGWLDIYVSRSAAEESAKRKNLLFINNKDLTFTESAAKYGLDDAGYTTHVSFFDYDLDGDLDMYAMNHSTKEFSGYNRLLGAYKDRSVPDIGERLYRNDNMRYVDVTTESGLISNVLGFGLGAAITDVNQDGWPDIYVGNDFTEEDYLYVNQKNGTFKESIREYFGHVSLYTMGCDAADINNDLKPDIITLDMLPEGSKRQKLMMGDEEHEKHQQLLESGFHDQTMRNMLQLNNGNGSFSEIGQYAGISNTDWSWAPLIADYDNDGWKDIFVSNGYTRNYLDMDFRNYSANNYLGFGSQNLYSETIEKIPPIAEENYIYHNNGDYTFNKKNKEWGLGFATMSNGAVYADLDNDGDLDLVTNNINEEAHIYRNNSETLTGNNYLKIKLVGENQNTYAIGSKVELFANGMSQVQELYPSRGYQSSVDYRLDFGLGKTNVVDSVVITWTDFSKQTITQVIPNQTLEVVKDNATKSAKHPINITGYFYRDTTRLGIAYKHSENDFLDFNKDRMLPHGISTAGPKLTRGDVNGDGLMDLYIGGAKGQAGILLVQNKEGTLKELINPQFLDDAGSEDTDAVFFDADGDADLDLYVSSGGVDFDEDTQELQDRLYLNDGRGSFSKSHNLPKMITSTSSVTIADIDSDGDLDIFAGGRLIPGQYPLAPRSYVLLNDGKGSFNDATGSYSEDLLRPGMVTDAEFVDLDGDTHKDLMLVGDWMNVSLFKNNQGKNFTRIQPESLDNTSGWWNTIHANDFDNDGDLDLVVGNFGNNNQYKPDFLQPISLLYNDFDGNETIDPLLFYYIQGEKTFAYSRDELIGQIANMKKKYPDYKSFSNASPSEYFTDEQLKEADTLRVTNLNSVYLKNKGGFDFEVMELPAEAQFSPIYAMVSLDIDDDGDMDLITAGNLSMTRASTGKYDASMGSLFLNDGNGKFNTIAPTLSGLNVRGDVRDIQLMEGENGNTLLFSVNNAHVETYRWADETVED